MYLSRIKNRLCLLSFTNVNKRISFVHTCVLYVPSKSNKIPGSDVMRKRINTNLKSLQWHCIALVDFEMFCQLFFLHGVISQNFVAVQTFWKLAVFAIRILPNIRKSTCEKFFLPFSSKHVQLTITFLLFSTLITHFNYALFSPL